VSLDLEDPPWRTSGVGYDTNLDPYSLVTRVLDLKHVLDYFALPDLAKIKRGVAAQERSGTDSLGRHGVETRRR